LRIGEARALEVRDVDLKRDRLLVRHARSADEVMPPKSGHERVVPLAPDLRVVLEAVMRLKMPHARVVANKRGCTPGRQHVLGAFKRLEAKLGLRVVVSLAAPRLLLDAHSARSEHRGGSPSGGPRRSSTSRNATCTPRPTT